MNPAFNCGSPLASYNIMNTLMVLSDVEYIRFGGDLPSMNSGKQAGMRFSEPTCIEDLNNMSIRQICSVSFKKK